MGSGLGRARYGCDGRVGGLSDANITGNLRPWSRHPTRLPRAPTPADGNPVRRPLVRSLLRQGSCIEAVATRTARNQRATRHRDKPAAV